MNIDLLLNEIKDIKYEQHEATFAEKFFNGIGIGDSVFIDFEFSGKIEFVCEAINRENELVFASKDLVGRCPMESMDVMLDSLEVSAPRWLMDIVSECQHKEMYNGKMLYGFSNGRKLWLPSVSNQYEFTMDGNGKDDVYFKHNTTTTGDKMWNGKSEWYWFDTPNDIGGYYVGYGVNCFTYRNNLSTKDNGGVCICFSVKVE